MAEEVLPDSKRQRLEHVTAPHQPATAAAAARQKQQQLTDGEVSAAATATGSRPGSNGSSRGGSSSRGQPAASPAGAVSAVDGLDPQMLAAVIGTTQREQLTASQVRAACAGAK